eukprot:2215614-Prymnesium_polylepis.1
MNEPRNETQCVMLNVSSYVSTHIEHYVPRPSVPRTWLDECLAPTSRQAAVCHHLPPALRASTLAEIPARSPTRRTTTSPT